MNNCCLNCQAKATKKKKKKIKEESDEDAMKQEQKVSENENPKTDSNDKKKKKKSILTWQHSSTKKEKVPSKNLLSQKNDVNPPCSTTRSMMYHGGPNTSNRWALSAVPRAPYPAFPMAPMYGPYGGGGGGPIQPYHSMPPATMYNGAQISPYPPMCAAAPFPHWGARPYMDSNPMKRFTSYAHNYSHFFI